MKKILYILILVIALVFAGCEEESEFSNNPPRIELITPTISGSIGETVTISAKLEDDYLLKYAIVISLPLAIDDQVWISKLNGPYDASKDVLKSSEDFSYDFTIPAFAAPGNNYEIKLVVKNVTGQTSSVYITLSVT